MKRPWRGEISLEDEPLSAGLPRTESLAPYLDQATDNRANSVFQRGACLGRYVVLRAIGSGGMGNVYAAYDPELDRKVALKVLRADVLLSEEREEAQSRLRREAQATAKLNHPNVVSVFDIGTVGERLFIAMELIEGLALTEWQAAEPRPWREALKVFAEAGRGLAAAHRVGLVHRDFKPGNVMIAEDGRVRVVDFGLARAVRSGEPSNNAERLGSRHGPDQPPALSLTGRGQTLGTPAYMAPEQHRGIPADARSDQFSYCMALYQALYDELPFGGAARSELRYNVLDGKVREAPEGSPVPGWVRRILLRGLAADPDARFGSMDELLTALAKDPASRRRRLLMAAAMFVVLAVAATGLFQLRARDEFLCKGAERKLQGIWDQARKADVRAAFMATGVAYAADTWARTEADLDAWTDAWIDSHVEACEATRRRGEQSEEMLDLRMACLDNRLHGLRGLVGILAGADEQVVRNAIQATGGLRRLQGCADLRTLADLEPPPEVIAEGVGRARTTLAEALALEIAGKYGEAAAVSKDALLQARELSYQPLVGEARMYHGLMTGRAGNRQEMREGFLDAVRIAVATRHRELLANALVHMILVAWVHGDPDEAQMWGVLAGAAVEALGERPDIEKRRLFFLGMAASLAGRHQEGIDYYRASLEITPADMARFRGPGFSYLGAAYLQLGRHDEALEQFRKALETMESTYPPTHPQLADPLRHIGNLLLEQERYEESLGYQRRALTILEGALGSSHQDLGLPLTSVGRAQLELGRPRNATATLERAVELLEPHAGDPAHLAHGKFHLARALWLDSGQRHRATTLARDARRTFADLGDRSQRDLEAVDRWLASRDERP